MESFYNNVTVINNSKKFTLKNAETQLNWGKWVDNSGNPSNPPTNLAAGGTATFQVEGRNSSSSGSDAAVTYTVWDDELNEAAGTIKFSFSCPYSGSNTAACSNSSSLTYALYTKINSTDAWGNEGAVPESGHPLYVQYTLSDPT